MSTWWIERRGNGKRLMMTDDYNWMDTMVATDAALTMIEASSLTVQTIHDRQLATDLFDAIRAFRKQSEAQKELTIRPLKLAYDDAKIPYDTFIKECQTHEKTLSDKMSAYDREVDRLARIEQARLQAITDRANAKIEAKAEARGIEPVLKAAPVVPTPPRTMVTQAGTTSTRVEKKVYGIQGVQDNDNISASDPRMAELVKQFPMLFTFDWVAFRKAASTGLLDGLPGVTSQIEYHYQQRGGR